MNQKRNRVTYEDSFLLVFLFFLEMLRELYQAAFCGVNYWT